MSKRVMGENEKAFKSVGAQLRKQGVQFRLNVVECCRGCISYEKLGAKSEDQPYGFTYGGQGGRITWSDDEVVYADSLNKSRRGYYSRKSARKVDTIYVNHGNDSAKKIVDAFQAAGFDAQWDGNDYSCVEINV